jgi:hypothetical protein
MCVSCSSSTHASPKSATLATTWSHNAPPAPPKAALLLLLAGRHVLAAVPAGVLPDISSLSRTLSACRSGSSNNSSAVAYGIGRRLLLYYHTCMPYTTCCISTLCKPQQTPNQQNMQRTLRSPCSTPPECRWCMARATPSASPSTVA